MKKYLKLLLIVICCFAGAINVSAEETFEKKGTYYTFGDSYRPYPALYVENESGIYKTAIYTFVNKTNGVKDDIFYCIDPHKVGGNSGSIYRLDRVLGDPSNSIDVQAYDYGILEILINGRGANHDSYVSGSNPYNLSFSLDNESLYMATSIASRMFTFIWGYGTGNTVYSSGNTWTGGNNKASAHLSYAIKILSESENSYLFDILPDSSCGRDYSLSNKAKCYSKLYSWYKDKTADKKIEFYTVDNKDSSYSKDKGDQILTVARNLFLSAMKKANQVIKDGNNAPSITKKGESNVVNNTSDGVSNVTEYITLSVANFQKDGIITNLRFECPNCNANGIKVNSFKYKNEKTGEWLNVDKNFDYLTLLDEKDGYVSGNLRFMLDADVNVDDKECTTGTEYKILYDYKPSASDTDEYEGIVVKAKSIKLKDKNGNTITVDGGAGDNYQRFVHLRKKNDSGSGKIPTGSQTGEFECVTAPACATEIELPICVNDDGSKGNATSSIKTNNNIKKCILNNTDEAGNTYQLKTENGVSDANKYCQVFCKEDYEEIKLNPIVNNVPCAGYFKLTSHVEGKKDCYTSGGGTANKEINKEQYIKDIVDAQKRMITNYDLYKSYEAALSHAGSVDGGTCASCSGSGAKYYDAITPSGSNTTYTQYYYNESEIDWNTGKVTWKSREANHVTDARYGSSGSCGTCGEGSSAHCCGCSGCRSGSLSELKTSLTNSMNNYKALMEQAYSDYQKILRDYNSCTTGWKNDYKFDQKVKYYYDEYHYNTPFTPYYELLSGKYSADDPAYYLRAQSGTLKTDKRITICTGGANSAYECNGTSIVIDGTKDDTTSPDASNYNYSSAYSEVFTNRSFTVCTTSGCSVVNNVPVSNATFVKKSVEKEQNYVSPSVFYQLDYNGRVTVQSGYANSTKLAKIIEGLPTSPKLTGGGIFKLMLEDFGEFYEDGRVGRLIDFNGDYEKESVAASQKDIGTFTGEYTCFYKSNCRTSKCPDCKFICDPKKETCHWEWCDPNVDPDCPGECPTCLFTSGKLQLNFKTISLTNFGSANRKYGYNWVTGIDYSNLSKSLQSQLKLLTEKAQLTIEEINEFNEMIYDADEATKTTEGSEFAFGIVMDPGTIRKVREYNARVEENGGYANDSLNCQTLKTDDGAEYSVCYSELINELIADGNVIVKDYRNDPKRYWESFEKYSSLKTGTDVIGGPAWK